MLTIDTPRVGPPLLAVETIHFVGLRGYSHPQNGGPTVRSLRTRKLDKRKDPQEEGHFFYCSLYTMKSERISKRTGTMQTNARPACVVIRYQCVRSDNVETLRIPSTRGYARLALSPPSLSILSLFGGGIFLKRYWR